MDDNKLWGICAFVYQHFAETTRAPGVDEVASRFALSGEEAASAYEELHERHALYFKPGTHQILMANPFSGVETPFKVRVDDRIYFANCAWDSLGIPAALLTIPQLWQLSRRWYQDRLSHEYHGRTLEQVQEIFKEVGLTSEFWSI
jgi:hypothetical protein